MNKIYLYPTNYLHLLCGNPLSTILDTIIFIKFCNDIKIEGLREFVFL